MSRTKKDKNQSQLNDSHSPKLRPKARYDFVGHITYPLTPDLRKVFFYDEVYVPVDIIKKDGVELSRQRIDYDFAVFLEEHGYTVEREHVIAPTLNRSYNKLNIACAKKSCLYYNEMYRGKCGIKMKAVIEVEKRMKRKEDETRHIVVTFKARDLNETSVKSNCILDYVKELTGIEGEPDTYGKMEMC